MRHTLRLLVTALLLLVGVALACEHDGGAAQSAQSPPGGGADERIDLDAVDHELLTRLIVAETNERRSAHDLDELVPQGELHSAACLHARAMVEQDFFAHRNPANPELATPADRVRAQGLEFSFVSENIGEVFALDYQSGEPVYTRQESGGTVFAREPGGEPLGVLSYRMLADRLLESWMASQGHRANILSEHPERLGVACAQTRDGELGMPMFRCVQLFFAPLR